MEDSNKIAQDVIQYVSIWTSLHDPEFGKTLISKSMHEIIPVINERYGSNFSVDKVKVSEFLYWFPIHQQNYIRKEKERISASIKGKTNEKEKTVRKRLRYRKIEAPA